MTSFRYILEVTDIDKVHLTNISKKLFEAYSTTILDKNLDVRIKPIIKRIEFLYKDTNFNSRELCNNFINNYYPNETVIKSQFVNHVLSRYKKNVSIFELKSFSSRADICKIGNISVAYEIKTEFDNFNRLTYQLNDYLKLYEKVYVITTKDNYYRMQNLVPLDCGVYIYTINENSEYKFTVKRKAPLSKKLDPLKQLESLSKRELISYFNCKKYNDKLSIIDFILKSYSNKKINSNFKKILLHKYYKNWNFLMSNYSDIYELDYQWFFQNNISPNIIYG